MTHISPPEYSNPKSGPVNSGLQPLPLHNRDITQPRANSKIFLTPRLQSMSQNDFNRPVIELYNLTGVADCEEQQVKLDSAFQS